eukprot:COSAG06_NODE_1370_length_9679_cov_17.259812_1_plen_241_part_00
MHGRIHDYSESAGRLIDLLIGSVYSRTNMVAARETAGCSSASVPHRGVTIVGSGGCCVLLTNQLSFVLLLNTSCSQARASPPLHQAARAQAQAQAQEGDRETRRAHAEPRPATPLHSSTSHWPQVLNAVWRSVAARATNPPNCARPWRVVDSLVHLLQDAGEPHRRPMVIVAVPNAKHCAFPGSLSRMKFRLLAVHYGLQEDAGSAAYSSGYCSSGRQSTRQWLAANAWTGHESWPSTSL